ncbi:MAG: hypothetical protein ACOX7B_03490 [Christensenellales bacterium]|jgi:hypothetical protein
MNGNRIREFAYKHSIELSALLAAIVVVSIHLISSIPLTLTDKPTLVTISVTLAGFLFTGQGIMLSLPTNNRFMQLLKEHGYLDDFHKLCRWAEMAFIGSVVFSLEVITGLFSNKSLANLLYLISFLWPLIMAFWALWIFGNVVGAVDPS